MSRQTVSVIIPCKNEANTIASIINALITLDCVNELIIVNDGSSDQTSDILATFPTIKVINHIYSKGNGAAIKSGARIATSDLLLFMDADGQHKPEEIIKLIETINLGFDMVVGARSNQSQASNTRLIGNKLYNRIATYITSHKIYDLTSGFRICNRLKFMEFIALLPNGFSYPTTITMAFFRSGYSVNYLPVSVNKRADKGHLSIVKDGIRFLLIIFKIATLYSPLKLFAPAAGIIFSSGLFIYLYTYLESGRFTNMSLLLFVTSVFVFIFGLISEQITMLIYLNLKEHKNN